MKPSHLIPSLTLAGVLLASSAHAVSLVGGVSLGGSYTTDNQDLTLATMVTIGPVGVSGASGSFAAEFINFGDPASFAVSNPLVFDPSTLPAGALYNFGDGPDADGGDGLSARFTFTLTSLSELAGTTSTTLNLFGNGFFHDTTGEYEDTPGTWNASFDRQGSGGTATFGFSSSSTTLPDGGTTVALFGLSLIGLAGGRRLLARKRG